MKFEETMLSGYIDGELSAEELAVVERRLVESPADRALLQSLTELHHKLSAMPEEIFGSDPVVNVRQRITAIRLDEAAELTSPSKSVSGSSIAPAARSQTTRPAANPNQANTSGSGRWWIFASLAATLLLSVGIVGLRKLSPQIASTTSSNKTETSAAGNGSNGSSRAAELADTEQSEVAEAESVPAATMATKMKPMDTSPDAELLIFSFEADDSVASPDRLVASDADFDVFKSVTLEVPEGQTEEALRWIEESLYEVKPANRQLPKLDPGQAVAIRVAGSPQQLAGLIQSVKSWSRDSNRAEPDSGPSMSMQLAGEPEASAASDGYVASESNAARSIGDASAAKLMQAPPVLEKGNSFNRSSMQLGSEVHQAVDAGEVWIVIRPRK